MACEQVRRAGNDALQPPSAALERHDIGVGAQRGDRRREQLLCGELGLRLVVVDVVVDDHLTLRRLAGLSGAQDNAELRVAHLLANFAYQLQPGIIVLHDDVEQDHRDIGTNTSRPAR